MRVRPIDAIVSSFLFSQCTYKNEGEDLTLNDVQKICRQDEYYYSFQPGKAYFLWDTSDSGKMYMFDETKIVEFDNKFEFGTTNYHFTETSDGYFVGLSFYVGRYFVATLWKLTETFYVDYKKLPLRFHLKRALTIPVSCAWAQTETTHDILDDTQVLIQPPFGNALTVSYTPVRDIKGSFCTEQLTDSVLSIITQEFPLVTFFTVNEYLSYQESLTQASSLLSYSEVSEGRTYFSYPYKMELLDKIDVSTRYDWEKYPELFRTWFATYPVFQRDSVVHTSLYLPSALFFGPTLLGLAVGMAVDSLVMQAISTVNTAYLLYASSHSNLYTSPCSNYTDFAVADMFTSLYLLAPGNSVYVGTYEPKLGFFIARFKNADTGSRHSPWTTHLDWYVSRFPVDNLQQQFPDEYLSFDYPVYTKIVFNTQNYDTSNMYWVGPLSKSGLVPIVGVSPIILKWDSVDFDTDLATDHYGNVPINKLVSDVFKDRIQKMKLGEWTKYNPNRWFVGKLETLVVDENSNAQVLECKVGDNDETTEIVELPTQNISTNYVLPLGVSLDRPVITEILTTVKNRINKCITKQKSQNTTHFTSKSLGKESIVFYFLVLLNDGELPVTPKTVTIRDTINSMFRYTGNKLWWYVGSLYQPGRLLTTPKIQPLMHYAPGANLSKVTCQSVLSHNTTNYMIKIFSCVMDIEYDIEFEVPEKKIKKLELGTSGVPLVGVFEDKQKNESVHFPKRIYVKATPTKISNIFSHIVENVKLSYTKIASKDEYLYWYFGAELYQFHLPTLTLNKYKLDVNSLDLLTNEQPEGIRLLADFRDFIEHEMIDSIFKPIEEQKTNS